MIRFSIRRIMALVALAAGLLWLARNYRPADLALPLFSLGITAAVWWVARHLPRLASWTFAVAGPPTAASFALICAFLRDLGGYVLMLLASLTMIPLVLGCGLAWAMAGAPARRVSDRAAWAAVLGLGLLPVSMMITPWPLRVAFALSRPAMDRLADRVAACEAVTLPEQAGFYEVVLVETDPSNGNVALIIDADPAGMSGFLRVAGRTSFGPLTNLNFNDPVGGPWFYQNED